MQTDFKEERKWKIATAYEVVQWVMEWHEVDDKQTVCVRVSDMSNSSFTSMLHSWDSL